MARCRLTDSLARRVLYFHIQMCIMMLGQAVAPFIAAPMMTYSLWLPLLAAPGIVAFGGLLIPMVPDTLAMRRYRENHNQASMSPRKTSNFDPSTTLWSRIRDTVRATIHLLKTRDTKLLLPAASLPVPIVTVSTNIVLRYIPVRFGWTLAQTGMFLGACVSLNILVSVFSQPVLAWVMAKSRKEERDLFAARVLIALFVVGMSLFAAAPNLAIALAGLVSMTFGSSAPALSRVSLFRLAANEGYSPGQVFGVLAFGEALGFAVCSFGFGALYQLCIHWAKLGAGGAVEENGWLVLVFYLAAVIIFVCGGMLVILDGKNFLQSDALGSDDENGDIARVPARRAATLTESEINIYEASILADGRVVRNGPCLDCIPFAP